MSTQLAVDQRFRHERAVAVRFLEAPNQDSFADLFNTFSRDSSRFFRTRGCDLALAEDLAQEVMFTVYRKRRKFAIVLRFVRGCSGLPVTHSAGTMASRRGKWKL